MVTTNFPNGVTSFGVPQLGNGDIPTGSGTYFFVDSNAGNDGYDGSFETPFATIDYAIGQCTADKGDVIVVKAGHAETLAAAAAITADVAGISIIGLGNGADRPTLTFGTLVTASLRVTASSVKIKNIVGLAALDALTSPFDIRGANCELDIEWQDGSDLIEATYVVVTTAAADNLKLTYRHRGYTTGSGNTAPVFLVGCNDGRVHLDCYGQATTAWVQLQTTASTNIEVDGYVYNTGITDGTKNVVASVGSCTWFANLYDGAAGSVYTGGSATSGTLSKFDVSAVTDALYGVNGITSWPTAATYGNAVSIAEVLAYVQDAVRNGSGAALATNKSLVDALGTTGAAVVDSAVSVLGAIGANNNNNAFASNTVVANADGSVLERLEYVQGEFATSLGTDGTTVTDSATTVLGAIGADNNNNAFASTSVVANADGSVLERIEYVQQHIGSLPATYFPGLGYKVTKTEDVSLTTEDLFTVTGKVLITIWSGEVTNALGAGVTDYKLRVKTDNNDLCIASNIASAGIGFLWQMCGDAGNSLINTATAKNTADTNACGIANRIVGLAGGTLTLQSLHSAGDASDAMIHTLWYMPLEAGAAVAAA